jgi:hypothetical protein
MQDSYQFQKASVYSAAEPAAWLGTEAVFLTNHVMQDSYQF